LLKGNVHPQMLYPETSKGVQKATFMGYLIRQGGQQTF
jgi:hypothetical protein